MSLFKFFYDNNTEEYILQNDSIHQFSLPKKIYGDYINIASIILDDYISSKSGISAIFLGDKGSGKTLIRDYIINKAYNLYNINIYNIYSTPINNGMIEILKNIKNSLITIDEFSKLFSLRLQQLLLTILSDKNNNNLYILTDNTTSEISEYLIFRPGRIKYLLDFNKVEIETLNEVMSDYAINDEFKKEIVDFYNKCTVFTYDHILTILEFNKKYPNLSFKNILKLLNIKENLKKYLSSFVLTFAYKESDKLDNEIPMYVPLYFTEIDTTHIYYNESFTVLMKPLNKNEENSNISINLSLREDMFKATNTSYIYKYDDIFIKFSKKNSNDYKMDLNKIKAVNENVQNS